MPTIVGISTFMSTFMSRKNFMLSSAEHEKSFLTSWPGVCFSVQTDQEADDVSGNSKT